MHSKVRMMYVPTDIYETIVSGTNMILQESNIAVIHVILDYFNRTVRLSTLIRDKHGSKILFLCRQCFFVVRLYFPVHIHTP